MAALKSDRWAKLRQLGRKQFVLRFGVLGWGVSTAVLFAGVESLHHGWAAFFVQLPIALVLFPLGGILWGRLMWWFLERTHDREERELIG